MRLREMRVGCFGGGTGLPSLLGGLKINPWLQARRGRDDVRQRRQFGCPARRARRAAAGRHPQVRARARAQRTRSAAGAAGASADARARAARRPHGRQPAALDDAELQRRLSRRDRRASRAAWLPRPRLAGQRRAGVGVRGVRRRLGHARAKSRSTRASRLADSCGGSGSSRRSRFIRLWPRRSASSTP